jgi:UDP-N-acetylglucosamine--N-acetylmuramyl-(pentapeptide) pyrophosphoryl-undecaprenol N-acetylglucosamine transferase
MNSNTTKNPYVAIACGGTGGHLFPGLAVAGQLQDRGCDVALLISPKDVDQQAVKSALERRSPARREPGNATHPAVETGAPFEVFTLPAVGLQNRNYFSFAGSFWKSFRTARKIFRRRRPDAVLAMGGFTSAPPVLAAKFFAAKKNRSKTFLHESNTIPGKANRFLARFVDEAFVGFPETAARLKTRKVTPTGTPVRPEFSPLYAGGRDTAASKLGLDTNRPVVLVVGGSQGATGLNTMVLAALPLLAKKNWQWLHLTGANDFERVKSAYATLGINAVVRPFLAEMDLALGVAAAAVSRAGASSLAELAALRLPALLVPFPAAADNHQFFNARIYALSGAARLLEQKDATPEKVAAILTELVEDHSVRAQMTAALELWHAPKSAEQIAANILRLSSLSLNAFSSEVYPGILTRGQAGPKNISAV